MPQHQNRALAGRIRNLIIVFAVSSILMDAGVRIIIDTLIACVIALIVQTDFPI